MVIHYDDDDDLKNPKFLHIQTNLNIKLPRELDRRRRWRELLLERLLLNRKNK